MADELLSEPVQRRDFLGAAGVILGSTQIPVVRLPTTRSPVPQVSVGIRQLAFPPHELGESWVLKVDGILNASPTGGGQAILGEDAFHTAYQLTQAGDCASEGLTALSQAGVLEFMELSYDRIENGSVRESYFVNIWRHESECYCLSGWDQSFSTAQANGLIPLRGVGDAAFVSVGGRSQTGKIFYRRYNVVVSVTGFSREVADNQRVAKLVEHRVNMLAKPVD